MRVSGTLASLALGAFGCGSPPLDAVPTSSTDAETVRIQAFLDERYQASDVWHSFRTKFGEDIDCVDFRAQPGVKALVARGVPIDSIPMHGDAPSQTAHKATVSPLPADVAFLGQPDDQGRPRACPEGSVPLLRLKVEGIKAIGGLDAFKAVLQRRGGSEIADPTCGSGPANLNYSWALATWHGTSNITDGVDITSIAMPHVPQNYDHSLSQIWMISGTCNAAHGCVTGADCTQTIELGWHVDPAVSVAFGLKYPTIAHLFVFSTNNGYNNNAIGGGGCYDNIGAGCLPFYVVSGALYTPGQALTNTTIPGIRDVDIAFNVYSGGTFWNVDVNGAGPFGVYPLSNYYGGMASGLATKLQVGSEVYDASGTFVVPMGTGSTPSAGYNWSAVHYNFEGCASGSGCDYSFNTPTVVTPTNGPFNYAIGYPSAPSGAINYFYVGDNPEVFWGQNYGYQWNPFTFDWAYGSYKGECGPGQPLAGISSYTSGQHQAHSILCGDLQPVTAGACYLEGFDSSMPGNPSWDWDPGYYKAECTTNSYVQGVSQTQSGTMNNVFCCPTPSNAIPINSSYCSTQFFYNTNSVNATTYGTQDWDAGYWKGMCRQGEVVAGVSMIASAAQGPVGAPHAVLCCMPSAGALP